MVPCVHQFGLTNTTDVCVVYSVALTSKVRPYWPAQPTSLLTDFSATCPDSSGEERNSLITRTGCPGSHRLSPLRRLWRPFGYRRP
ncbi:hypothetical protein NDU88_001025 [Pleurodeles waltl]|uniref:Uncharacterized protein n=1 Tax=Pleurodeles waltl TaxID=8319 RepID=A0AAV7P6R2_PLEWA|nr:hypothetical protein NDU88_001025 [Pleurodeles waltl]